MVGFAWRPYSSISFEGAEALRRRKYCGSFQLQRESSSPPTTSSLDSVHSGSAAVFRAASLLALWARVPWAVLAAR